MSNITFIGGGNMATAIIDGILRNPDLAAAHPITVSDPHPDRHRHFTELGLNVVTDNVAAASGAEVIFFAVKPQVLPAVLAELGASGVDFSGKLLITMAAGTPVSKIASPLHTTRLIRIMPNTPARIGAGLIGIYFAEGVSAADRTLASALLSGTGELVTCASEAEIDVLGVAAGCGPALVFKFMEDLIAGAVAHGFDPERARTMVTATVLGTAALAKSCPKESLADMREAVTSKGGTTAAALAAMAENGFDEAMARGFAGAMRRTRELAGETL